MKRKRRNHSAEFKARVALEAVQGIKTAAEIFAYGVHFYLLIKRYINIKYNQFTAVGLYQLKL